MNRYWIVSGALTLLFVCGVLPCLSMDSRAFVGVAAAVAFIVLLVIKRRYETQG